LLAILAKSIAITIAILGGKSNGILIAIVFEKKYCKKVLLLSIAIFHFQKYCIKCNTKHTTSIAILFAILESIAILIAIIAILQY